MIPNANSLSEKSAKIVLAEPAETLFDRIINRLRLEKRILSIKRRIVIFSACSLVSAAIFVQVFKITWAGFSASGFGQFFSLLFSDFRIVAGQWQNFLWSLLESLPITDLILFLLVTWILFQSLKSLAKNLKNILTARVYSGD